MPLLQRLDEIIFGNSCWSKQQWRSELESGETMTELVKVEGEACGFITAGVAGDELEVRKIGILPEFRRRGLARQLLTTILSEIPLMPRRCLIDVSDRNTSQYSAAGLCRSTRRCLIDVSDRNTEGIAFYRALGFSEIGRRRNYYSGGSSAIVMEKILSAPQANPYIT